MLALRLREVFVCRISLFMRPSGPRTTPSLDLHLDQGVLRLRVRPLAVVTSSCKAVQLFARVELTMRSHLWAFVVAQTLFACSAEVSQMCPTRVYGHFSLAGANVQSLTQGTIPRNLR